MQALIDVRSNSPIFGWFDMALYMVGTPRKPVGFFPVDIAHHVVEHEARMDDHLGAEADRQVHHRGHGEDVEEGQDGH